MAVNTTPNRTIPVWILLFSYILAHSGLAYGKERQYQVYGPQSFDESGHSKALQRAERNLDSDEPDFLQPEQIPLNVGGKRRQYVALAPPPPPPIAYAPAPLLQPAVPILPPPPPPPPAGVCPGGPSLPIECDPKRPWPQCPPQSYCYATNSVDIGPYFCCPVWSTYGAAWRPATPFYNYVPPPPPNWSPVMRAAVAHWPAAAVGLPARRARKPAQRRDEPDSEELRHMLGVVNDWVARGQSEPEDK